MTIRSAITALIFAATSVHAALVETAVNSTTQSAYSGDVSSSDLLHGLTGVDSGVAWKLPSSRLNNGSHGPDTNTGHISWADPGSVVTFDLGVGAGAGWNITSVQSIAAWNSAGFGNQGYTLEMKLVGAGSYTTIATVLYNPLGGGGGATKVTLTDDGGSLAGGVQFVRFTHNSVPGTSGNEVTYREFDVFGTAVAAGPAPPVAVDDTATFSENVDPNANSLLGLDGLATGLHTFNALAQDFQGYVEQHDGNGWLLIGRGREGSEFDTDGQGTITDVSQNLGTSAGFAAAAYSDAQVQDLLDQAALGMVNIEMRLKRATALDGSGTYQDVRWRNFLGNGNVFTWNIEDSQYTVTQEFEDLGGLAGQLQGTTNVTPIHGTPSASQVTTATASSLGPSAGTAINAASAMAPPSWAQTAPPPFSGMTTAPITAFPTPKSTSDATAAAPTCWQTIPTPTAMPWQSPVPPPVACRLQATLRRPAC